MKVVDLTHPLRPDTPVLEGDAPVGLTRTHFHETDGYQVTTLSLGSHTGTHLDAPRHFLPQGATLDSFPADRFVRPGWIVDVRPPEVVAPGTAPESELSTASDTGELPQSLAPPPLPTLASPFITFASQPLQAPPAHPLPLVAAASTLVAGSPPLGEAAPTNAPSPAVSTPRVPYDLLAERLRHVALMPGDFLLLWTGGTLLADDSGPLLLKTGAGLVGTDAFSLDDAPYPAHHLLLEHGVLLAENLANLDKLGPGKVMCAFLPLLWLDADGAPMRAVAWR